MNTPIRILAALALCTSAAFAQTYPSHPIKVIVPWPPGQATDVAARMVAERLSPVLGQPLVVDNHGGAGGVIGCEMAAKSPADGYTLVAGSSGPISISPNVQKVAYDPLKDFAPISLLAVNPFMLVVNPSIPAKNVKELIALLKASPGKYSFASSGSGATSHLMSVLFNSMAGVDVVHVPYKGSSQSITDVVNGQIAYTIETVPAVQGLVQAGKLRALGMSGLKRSPLAPDIPTIDEAGVKGYEMGYWFAAYVPHGTPAPVVARLRELLVAGTKSAEAKNFYDTTGSVSWTTTSDELAKFQASESQKWGQVIKAAGIEPE